MDSSIKFINLRCFNLVGAHSSSLLDECPQDIPNDLIPFISRVASGRLSELKIFAKNYSINDITGVCDYIHVLDLAERHLAAAASLSRSHGLEVFNLDTGYGFSVLQTIRAFETASQQKIQYIFLTSVQMILLAIMLLLLRPIKFWDSEQSISVKNLPQTSALLAACPNKDPNKLVFI